MIIVLILVQRIWISDWIFFESYHRQTCKNTKVIKWNWLISNKDKWNLQISAQFVSMEIANKNQLEIICRTWMKELGPKKIIVEISNEIYSL